MKEKIGLFWGSDTGTTEVIVNQLVEALSEKYEVVLQDMYKVKNEDFDKYSKMVFALSTWYDGDLQSDWDVYFESFCTLDFSGKTIAICGPGDQYGYGEFFCDGIGIIGQQVLNTGGRLVGEWSTEGYDYDESKAELKPGIFCGLPLDEDNQSDMTKHRLEKWTAQILNEFENELEPQS